MQSLQTKIRQKRLIYTVTRKTELHHSLLTHPRTLFRFKVIPKFPSSWGKKHLNFSHPSHRCPDNTLCPKGLELQLFPFVTLTYDASSRGNRPPSHPLPPLVMFFLRAGEHSQQGSNVTSYCLCRCPMHFRAPLFASLLATSACLYIA